MNSCTIPINLLNSPDHTFSHIQNCPVYFQSAGFLIYIQYSSRNVIITKEIYATSFLVGLLFTLTKWLKPKLQHILKHSLGNR